MQPSAHAGVPVLARPSIFDPARELRYAAPIGCSIAELVAQAMPEAARLPGIDIRAYIAGIEIAPEHYSRIRPKVGAQVLLVAIPAGDDGLRTFLQVAVTIAAVAAGQFYAPTLLAAVGVTNATATTIAAASAVITTTTLIAGNLLLNALVPPRTDEKDKPIYAIQGTRNQMTPGGVIPLILGKIRYAPPYATTPVTEAVGDERYVTNAFVCACNPVVARDWKIGETPIERYKNFNLETRNCVAGAPPLTLTPNIILEEPFSIALQSTLMATGGPQIRTTDFDCTECSIDITFPGGLFETDSEGRFDAWTVEFTHRYRLVGTTTWINAPRILVTSNKRKQIVRTVRLVFPARGRYEIELQRLTADWDEADQSKRDTKRSGRSFWTALRSIKPEYPIDCEFPLFLAAARIRASGQLNGALDSLSAEFSSVCPDWDVPTQTWISRETNNPASLFRFVLSTNPALTYPLTLAEIDDLSAWHAFCVAKGLAYNRVHDYEASVLDVLLDIAAAGRATPRNGGTKWGAVIDRAISYISAHIGPRNSWGFEGDRAYAVYPDAFRVSFLDETNDYRPAERIVPWPGFTGAPKVFEKQELPGITNPDLVWKESRRRQYEIVHRPDSFVVNQDFEHLVIERGDRVQLNHDVLDSTQRTARVVSAGGSTVVIDDTVVMEAGKSYAFWFQRPDGSSVTHSVVTAPGETATLTVTSAGPLPEVPDKPGGNPLIFFGVAGRVSLDCTVRSIEAMDHLTARITLIPHAPVIETLVDAEVPPPWSGRAGGPAQESTDPPLLPIVEGAVSGLLAQGVATDDNPYPILVTLSADPSNTIPIGAFDVRHRITGASTWQPAVSAPPAAGAVMLSGYARGNSVDIQGRAVSLSGVPSGWTATLAHVVAETDPAPPAPPTYSSATQSAPHVVDHVYRAPSDSTVRNVQLVCARGYGATVSQASVVATIAAGQNQAGVYTGSVDVGLFRFWMKTLNAVGIASDPAPAAGPREILAPRQLDNLLTAPDDMTNAAWVKNALTPSLSGTGPDGVTTSLVVETTATTLHWIGQEVTFSGGSATRRVRYVQGLKAAGRSRARLYIYNADRTSSAYAPINLATGTVGTVVYAGTAVTLATVTLEQVSSDVYLVLVTATVVSGGAEARLLLLDDSGASSYAGDTSKGVYTWAASLAVLP